MQGSALITRIVFLAGISAFGSLACAAEAYFEEQFIDPIQNQNLEPYSPFFSVSGGVIQRTAPGDRSDRRYIRTVISDYGTRDFTYEVTFTTKDDIVFIGIGEGVRSSYYNEPANDGDLDISDGIYLLNWRFLTGSPPHFPFPDCGPDLTEDGLAPCEEPPTC